MSPITYLHNDHLGSAGSGTLADGTLAWREEYSPFGQTMLNAAANDNQAGFTGHMKDSETGLNYMQARYYDPVIGRFLSVDPVTFLDTGDTHQFNRYAYANNDPVNIFDPDGRDGVKFKFEGAINIGPTPFVVEVGIGVAAGRNNAGNFEFGGTADAGLGVGAAAAAEAVVEGYEGSIKDSTQPSVSANVNIPIAGGIVGVGGDISGVPHGSIEASNQDLATSGGFVDRAGDAVSKALPDITRTATGGGYDLKSSSLGIGAGASAYVALSNIASTGWSSQEGGFGQFATPLEEQP